MSKAKVEMIANEIKETVAPLMERWVADRVALILDLKKQINAIDGNDEYNNSYAKAKEWDRFLSRSSFKINWFLRQGYGKGDYQLAAYYPAKDIQEKMEKEAANKLKKIDVAVAKKISFDVDAVEKMYFTEGKDGYFEGAWKLNGEKVFSFDTFYAGGYNIQCLHVRTKYKLK